MSNATARCFSFRFSLLKDGSLLFLSFRVYARHPRLEPSNRALSSFVFDGLRRHGARGGAVCLASL